MRQLIIIIVVGLIVSAAASASEPVASFYSRNDFLMAPPGEFEDGLLGFVNPANLGFLHAPEMRFLWSTRGADGWSFEDWGLFAAVPHLGFDVVRRYGGGHRITDYRFALGVGDNRATAGVAYGWSTGDTRALGRQRMFALSTISRPSRYLSAGIIGNVSTQSNWKEGVLELGVRPLGTPQVTLFADAAWAYKQQFDEVPWSMGAAVQVVPGLNLTGRYFEGTSFTLGLTFNFGYQSVAGQSYFDTDQDIAKYSYGVRVGGLRPSFFPEAVDRGQRMLTMDMKGTVSYNRYEMFDTGHLRFMNILTDIRAAVDDPRVSAIVLNLSGLKILPEQAWEIREELRKAQESGLIVAVFIDRVEMTLYHLASVADVIALDPEGWVALPGYRMGRTFFKGTLEKLGLGFDEWRFFKYKSAMESYSRDNMSPADSSQRQALVDAEYDVARVEICQSRNLSYDEFDSIVNEQVFLLPQAAVQAGLVDTLARWPVRDEIVAKITGRSLRSIGADGLFANAIQRRDWGPRPKIAVVYALGVCAMDSGIRARWLSQVFRSLKDNRAVKAIVFRVDSPGGDGLASDIVAQAMRECAEVKPVVVSQGQVAASGGYWISMYADTIVAAPITYTGSIGVIGGWIYDNGFGKKLGMTADVVKRGDHADLGFGIRLPLVGLQLPARNLTDEEYARMEEIILTFYRDFVSKVADGRHMPMAHVEEIAQGHVYSGIHGLEIGLVDVLGGMEDAIAIARRMAHLTPDEDAEIIEIPKSKGLFKMPGVPVPSIATGIEQDPVYQYLKMYSGHLGQPLPMLLPGMYPTID